MFSANMLSFLLFAVTPLLVQAQSNQQTPLNQFRPDLVVPLTLNDERNYFFKSALSSTRQLDLNAVHEIVRHGTLDPRPNIVSIHIPLDPTEAGRMVLGSIASKNTHLLQEIEWINNQNPGKNIPITHVGIRKGGMVAIDAYATRLALETPYISLPDEIYDILAQATNPTTHQYHGGYDDVVDCDALERFPDLVLGLEPETDEEDDEDVEEREVVITPNQYVLKREDGKCILLARRSYQKGHEEVVLGWAAVRGRDVVLDWVNERTGFGR